MPPEVGESEVEDLANDADGILSDMNAGLDGDGGKSGSEGEAGDRKTLDIGDILPDEKKDVHVEGEGEGEGEGKEGEGKEKEEEEEEEDEDLLESEDEEELGEGEPQLIKDIEKAYPKLFKQFKGVKLALLRDNAFSQVFTSPKEARDVAQLNEDYRTFEHELLAGNNTKVLKAIRDTSEVGYKKFVSGILPTLAEHDPNTYKEIASPVIAATLRQVLTTGMARNDKNLVNSAKHIASLLWPDNKGEIPNITAGAQKSDPALEERERQIAEREKNAEKKDAEMFVGSIKGTCNRLLRKRVEKGMDPNNVLTPFVKNSVVEKTMVEVQELLNEDLRFNRVMDQTFARAKRSGYSGEYKTRMVGTYIGRASQLIGPIRRRLLLQALGKQEPKGKGEGEAPPMRRAVGEGGAGGSQNRILKASEIDWERASDLDILNGKQKSRRATK